VRWVLRVLAGVAMHVEFRPGDKVFCYLYKNGKHTFSAETHAPDQAEDGSESSAQIEASSPNPVYAPADRE